MGSNTPSDDPCIPALRFDGAGMTRELALAAWQELTSPVFDTTPAPVQAGVAPRFATYHLGDILVGVGEFDATCFTRSRAKARADGLDHLMVQIYTRGGYRGELGSRTVNVAPGDVVTLDMARETRTVSTASANITLMIPRDLLGARALPHGPHVHDVASAACTQLFAEHVLALAPRLDTLRQSAAPYLADATLSLYRAALAPSADALAQASEPVHHTLLLRARRLIETRLDGQEVSAESLANALRMSRATLYRLFEPFGGVAAYVLERRLLRARSALRDGRDLRRINQVASDCGFGDASHFSRAFRRRFGMTPADARQLRNEEGPAATPARGVDLAPWITQLI
jgi:AraC-like DNA-binding protein